MNHPAASAEGVSKHFGATVALDGVDFDVDAGEIHAVVGENGAGKSTLIRILGGVWRPDRGTIRVDGAERHFASPRDAIAAGIVTIPQELRLVPALSIAENIALGDLPVRRFGPLALVDREQMRVAARAVLAQLDFDPDPDRPVASLGFAERQLVAIAKALRRQCRVFILDEPTAALEKREIERLFAVLTRMKAQGTAIIYISHHLDEVVTIADRCTILRDGRVAAVSRRGAFSAHDLVAAMTGRAARAAVVAPFAPGELLLQARPDGVAPLTLRAREVIGLAGLLGSGSGRIIRALFGVAREPMPIRVFSGKVDFRFSAENTTTQRVFSGKVDFRFSAENTTTQTNPERVSAHDRVNVNGTRSRLGAGERRLKSPADAIAAGIGMVPGERSLGLVMNQSVRDNILLPNLAALARMGWLDRRAGDRIVAELMELVDIRPRWPQLRAGALSGGNQQKVILAKWLARRIAVLLLDEPTQGIDVAAKAQIHGLIRDFVARGGGALIHSSDLAELSRLCDGVLAVRQGRIVATLDRASGLDEPTLRAAIGG
jgi:ABC-type sugar transport system ATPase subunit